MISALDTNVLLDVLIPKSPYADASRRVLNWVASQGRLIVCDVVYAELAAHFRDASDLDRFLADTRIELVPFRRKDLVRAGVAFREYRRRRPQGLVCPRCGTLADSRCPGCGEPLRVRQHVLADFLIGAHALQADRLVTRDRGFYKTYFRELRLLSPA